MNPHCFILLEVVDAATGAKKVWSLEGGNTAGLFRRGWTPNTLKPGDRDHDHRAAAAQRRAGRQLQQSALGRRQADRAETRGGRTERTVQRRRFALRVAALLVSAHSLRAARTSRAAPVNPYPDWSGQWARIGSLNWEPEGYEKAGPPPLTPEYQAIREQYLAQREQGILAGDPPATCLPPGMPRVMTMSFPMEIIVTPKITYIYADWESQVRRVYTDGRTWPEYILPEFNGYSIGAVARRERRRRLRHAVDRDARHERPALVRLGGRRAAREQSRRSCTKKFGASTRARSRIASRRSTTRSRAPGP